MLYAGPEQINAVVPDAPGAWAAFTAGESTLTLPVAAAAPNADGTVNAAGNAAARGSAVTIYATGTGQGLPLTLFIGGVETEMAGVDDGLGLLAITATVPAALEPGEAVAVVLRAGDFESPAGRVLAVR